MSDQELHDDIEKIVTALKSVIPVLQSLGDTASHQIDKKLNGSIRDVDDKIGDLNRAVHRLSSTVESNNIFFIEAENKALEQLKEGVKELTATDVKKAYSAQIAQVVASIEPLVTSKINIEIEKLVEHKKLSISDHNKQVESINDQLEENMKTINDTLLVNIEKLNKASTKAYTRTDTELEQLNKLATAHSSALQRVQSSTDTTAAEMEKTLTSVKRRAVFISQSPATITALTAGFLALCLMCSIVYVYGLWKPMFLSAISLGAFLVMIWGLREWLDNREE